MQTITKCLAFLAAAFFATAALADYVAGTITNISSIAEGLVVIIGATSIPANCAGTPYGWLLIPQANKAMIALALIARSEGKLVTVYSNGAFALTTSGNFCVATQLASS